MTFASMPPPKTMPSAREEDAGPAAFAPTTAATAQNAPRRHGCEEAGAENESEVGRERDDDVSDRENNQRRAQGHASGNPERQDRHRRRADDHSDREDGDHQADVRDRRTEVTRDFGKNAGDDEFGCAHQENSDGQHVDHERQAAGFFDGRGGNHEVVSSLSVDDAHVVAHPSRASRPSPARESRSLGVLEGTPGVADSRYRRRKDCLNPGDAPMTRRQIRGLAPPCSYRP